MVDDDGPHPNMADNATNRPLFSTCAATVLRYHDNRTVLIESRAGAQLT